MNIQQWKIKQIAKQVTSKKIIKFHQDEKITFLKKKKTVKKKEYLTVKWKRNRKTQTINKENDQIRSKQTKKSWKIKENNKKTWIFNNEIKMK